MVRIGGSFAGIAHTFKAVADHYGWTHIVLVSDDNATQLCWLGAKPFDDVFGNENYSFTWLRWSSQPTDEQLDDILQLIRSRTRGLLTKLFHFNAADVDFQAILWLSEYPIPSHVGYHSC